VPYKGLHSGPNDPRTKATEDKRVDDRHFLQTQRLTELTSGRDQGGIDVSRKFVVVFAGYAGSWTDRTPRIPNRLIAEHKVRIANTEFWSAKQLDRLRVEI
jgi:hypothetical protein